MIIFLGGYSSFLSIGLASGYKKMNNSIHLIEMHFMLLDEKSIII